MWKIIILLFYCLFLILLVEHFFNGSADKLKSIRIVSESPNQFTIQWLYKQQNRLISESNKYEDNIIGDLYSRFHDTNQMALESQKFSDLNRMQFPVIGKSNNLVHSEVRFYRNCSKTDRYYRQAVNFTVYRVLRNEFNDQLLYINSIILPDSESGWFSVNITDCYRYWMTYPEKNNGIQVVTKFKANHLIRIRPELTGIVDFDGEAHKHAFLVNFFGNSREDDEESFLEAEEVKQEQLPGKSAEFSPIVGYLIKTSEISENVEEVIDKKEE